MNESSTILTPASALAEDARQAGAEPLNGNGFYRFKIGDFQATVISDGYGPIPVGPIFAMNVSEAELAPVLKANFMPPVIQATNNPFHVGLSDRTRGLVGAPEFALMKPTARLVNTSRGPIVVEADLIAALKARKIAGAAIDVFDQEPLLPDHPFRTLANLLATPHIGFVSRGLYTRFYQDTVENIRRWLDGQAIGG
jgi:hypothetical protein